MAKVDRECSLSVLFYREGITLSIFTASSLVQSNPNDNVTVLLAFYVIPAGVLKINQGMY